MTLAKMGDADGCADEGSRDAAADSRLFLRARRAAALRCFLDFAVVQDGKGQSVIVNFIVIWLNTEWERG